MYSKASLHSPSLTTSSLKPRSPRQNAEGRFQPSPYKVSALQQPSHPFQSHRHVTTSGLSIPVLLKKKRFSDPPSPSATSTSFFSSTRSQKKTVQRAGVLATLVFAAWLLYTSFTAPRTTIALASYSPKANAEIIALPTSGMETDTLRLPSGTIRSHGRNTRKFHHLKTPATSVKTSPWSPQQELAALVSFITSTAEGTLPENADSAQPLDPEWLLDFDVVSLSTEARESRLAAFINEVWYSNPVVVFAKGSSVWSTEVETLLQSYKMSPHSVFINVEGRRDERLLSDVISRLTGQTTLPSVVIGGVSVGGYEELKALHDAGRLTPLLEGAGVKLVTSKPSKKMKQKKINAEGA